MANARQRGSKWSARWRSADGASAEKGGFLDKKSAIQYAEEQEALERRNIKTRPSETNMTLDYFVQHIWAQTLNVKQQTLAGYEAQLNSYISPHLGDMAISDIKPVDIEKWVAKMTKSGLAPRTVERHRLLLATILKKAYENDYIRRNPFKGLKFKKAQPLKKTAPLSFETVKKMAKKMPAQYQMLVWIGFYTGMRPSEALGLSWSQLDFEAGTINIDRQISRNRNTTWEDGLKTKTSPRKIGFAKELQNLISEHVDKFGLGPSNLILQNRVGGVLRYSDAAETYRKYAREFGIQRGEGLHQLRHTCVSVLINQGAHPKEIQAWVGHSSIEDTMDIYGHLFPDAMGNLASKLDAYSTTQEQSIADAM